MTDHPGLSGPSLSPSGDPRQIVILLHGYGSNGADMLSLAPAWRASLPDAVFLAPNAPEPVPGLPGGYQWWGLTSMSRPALASGVERARPALDDFIDAQLAAYGLTEAQLLLVGFSQGTMMALHVGPLRERQIAGIVGYSGILVHPHVPAGPRSRPPVMLIHGEADPVVPFAGFVQSVAELRALGFQVESHATPDLEHSVDQDGLAMGARFARRVLGIA